MGYKIISPQCGDKENALVMWIKRWRQLNEYKERQRINTQTDYRQPTMVRSLGLLSPRHVIAPRLYAGQTLDYALDGWPEAKRLEGVVKPAGGDAVVGLMRRDVMYSVVISRQDDV